MRKELQSAEAVAGIILTTLTLLYLLMAMYALLPEWKRERVRMYLKKNHTRQTPNSPNWSLERTILQFRREISDYEHAQSRHN